MLEACRPMPFFVVVHYEAWPDRLDSLLFPFVFVFYYYAMVVRGG